MNVRGADVQEHRRNAVHFPVHVHVGEAVDDCRHVPQPHDRAVDVCNQHDVQEVLAHHAFLVGAKDQSARIRTQLSRGHVERGLANRPRQLGNGQVVAPQLLLADDNRDFPVRRAEKGNHRERRQRQQVFLNPLGGGPQFRSAERRRGYGNGHDDPVRLGQHDFRLLGVEWRESFDAIDRRHDVVEDGNRVRKRFQLDGDGSQPLGGRGRNPPHPFDGDQVFLQPAVDAFLDFGGRTARERDRYGDLTRIQVRIVLDFEIRSGEKPTAQKQQHQQVARYGISREKGDDVVEGVIALGAGSARRVRRLIHALFPPEVS